MCYKYIRTRRIFIHQNLCAMNRRSFIRLSGASGLAIASNSIFGAAVGSAIKKGDIKISLAQWSLHKSLFANKISNLEFPEIAKKKFNISAVEYVNAFFKDKAEDTNYLNQLLQRSKDNGVYNHLIMIDSEGDLGNPNDAERSKSVHNHYKWVHAAKHLGCATIRVNAFGEGSREQVKSAAIDGLSKLGEYAAKEKINVVVENHGNYSSDGSWMLEVLKGVNMKNVGMLPDFGNFCVKRDNGQPWGGNCLEEYDKYKGVKELLPFAKGVSAKTIDFDDKGNCVETDYNRMMKIIIDGGFKGYIGIEFEGEHLNEEQGIMKTKQLLERYL